MKPDDFEKRLQSQPMRQIPREWRTQILQTENSSHYASSAPRRSRLSTIIHQLTTIVWFNSKAWAGLAAVWGIIFLLQSTSHSHSGIVATVPAPQPSQFLMSLKDQQQTLVELMGSSLPDDLDRPRHVSPKPRSERRRATMMI